LSLRVAILEASLSVCYDKHSHSDKDFCMNLMKIVIRFRSITTKISEESISPSMKLSKKFLLTIQAFCCHKYAFSVRVSSSVSSPQ
jgi:hypothetical protein